MKPTYIIKIKRYGKGKKYGMIYVPKDILDEVLERAEYVEVKPIPNKRMVIMRPVRSVSEH